MRCSWNIAGGYPPVIAKALKGLASLFQVREQSENYEVNRSDYSQLLDEPDGLVITSGHGHSLSLVTCQITSGRQNLDDVGEDLFVLPLMFDFDAAQRSGRGFKIDILIQ